MSKADEAEKLFLEGANCAQAVVGAFADEIGIPQSSAFKLASGFGGGIGRTRNVCGAVSGMVLVLNALRGNEDISDKNSKDVHYALIQRALSEFKAETSSIICRELLGLPPEGATAPVSENRTPAYYKKRPCSKMVALGAEIAEKLLADTAK